MDDLTREKLTELPREIFFNGVAHPPAPPPPRACEIILARDSPRPIRRCNTGAGYRFSRWMALMVSIIFVGGQVGFWHLFCLAVFGKLQGGEREGISYTRDKLFLLLLSRRSLKIFFLFLSSGEK